MKLITSNIRFENPSDGMNSWPHRINFLSELLNSEKPVIIGTQEGREGQLRQLESKLIHHRLIDNHRSWIDERMYPSLFINETIVEVIESGDIWLSETPNVPGSKSFNSAFPRLATWVSITHLLSKENFLVVNCHLDHLDTNTRLKQIQVLVSEVQKIKEEKSVIIMGDFNDSPQSIVRKEISKCPKLNLYDPWEKFNLPEETTYHKFLGENVDSEFGSRIDWILTDKKIEALNMKLLKGRSEENILPSDHYPVLLEINL